MILKSIIARRFRGIKNENPLSFVPGLNIVKGSDNEAGKSSLRIAITKALFQDPTSASEEVRKLTKWGVEEPWEVELEFQTDSGLYHISKSLKDKACKLDRIDALEKPVTSKTAIAAKITEFTGCPSEVFFESTACIAQDEMIRLIPSGVAPSEKKTAFGTLTQRLQDPLSGAGGGERIDVHSILTKLYSKTHNKPAKGPLYYLSNTEGGIQKFNAAKVDQEKTVNDLIDKRKELNSIKEQLEQVNKDLPAKQDLLRRNNRILELQDAISRDRHQYGGFERAKQLRDKLDDIEKQLKEFTQFSGKETELKQLDDAREEIQDWEKQKIDAEDGLKAVDRQEPALWKLMLGVLGVVLFIGGLVGGLVVKQYLYPIIGVALGGSLFGYWLVSQMVWQRQKTSLSRELENLEGEIQSKLNLAKPFLDSLGFANFDEYHSERNKYAGKQAERKEPYDKLSGLLGDKDWEQFKSENSGLAIRVIANQEELNKILPYKLAPLELQQLDTEINGEKGLLKRKAELEGQKTGLGYFFQHTDADTTDQLANIKETLERLEQERKFWERKRKVFETTRQVLEEAHNQTLSKAATVLEKKLGGYISTITDGRYTQVKINESNLSIQALSPEKNGLVDVTELSRATQDQFYICARFALINLITEGKKPPLLLDDPFVNFHQKRLDRMIPLLQGLAKENQILLFTCSDAYDNYGNVISVD